MTEVLMTPSQYHDRLDIEKLEGQTAGWHGAAARVMEMAKTSFVGNQDEQAKSLREVATQLTQEGDKTASKAKKKRTVYEETWEGR